MELYLRGYLHCACRWTRANASSPENCSFKRVNWHDQRKGNQWEQIHRSDDDCAGIGERTLANGESHRVWDVALCFVGGQLASAASSVSAVELLQHVAAAEHLAGLL